MSDPQSLKNMGLKATFPRLLIILLPSQQLINRIHLQIRPITQPLHNRADGALPQIRLPNHL